MSKVGGFEPFYAYKIKHLVHKSDNLNIHERHRILELYESHSGPTEIGSLFLHPDYREGLNGRLLSLSRFLYLAEHPEAFESDVIAEMRGVVDADGHSPFWEAIGRHFFTMDFPQADYLSVVDKSFIADLMPRHPIYIEMLPKEAQQVINRVHRNTRPALAILEKQGFKRNGMVDIFEAGPIVQCPLKDILAVKKSKRFYVRNLVKQIAGPVDHLVINTSHSMHACLSAVKRLKTGISLPADVGRQLNIKKNDAVRILKLSKKK